ncbi:MAG TPA: MYG1 family protein [Spirochaetota bacterium]|nr:MYG1 family protein [Spirochaetota bacterium]
MDIKSIAVHDGVFHADDIFAAAIIRMIWPEVKIIRSRNMDVLQGADLRIDVGGKNCPSSGDYDHHLENGAGTRSNGIPYASCGLIWKEFGMRLAKTRFRFEHIDRKIIQSIDATDCGYSFGEENNSFAHFTISDIFDSFNPSWFKEDNSHDEIFEKAVVIAIQILKNELEKAEGFELSRDYIYAAIDQSVNPFYIVLDKYVPWQHIIINETEFIYVIFPSTTGDWRVRAVPRQLSSFESRKPLPKKWAGKREEELARITGVKDATFCHPARFIAGAQTLEGALMLAEKALE